MKTIYLSLSRLWNRLREHKVQEKYQRTYSVCNLTVEEEVVFQMIFFDLMWFTHDLAAK